jgi:hypothetical protein
MENTPIQNTPQTESVSPLVKQNRRLKTLLVISLTLLVLSLSFIALIFFVQEETPITESTTSVEEKELEDEVKDEITYQDFSEYTDIELENYEGLRGTVSGGDSQLKEEGIISGIVVLTRDMEGNRIEQMRIVNRKVLDIDQEEYFNDTYEDIMNKNLDIAPEPRVLITTPFGTPRYEHLLAINNVEYPNTDNTFAILSLAHGHSIATTGRLEDNYQIFVFSTKDENIIQLSSTLGNLMIDFDLSEEDNETCSKLLESIPEEDRNEYSYEYDVDCLKEVFESGKYDESIRELTEGLIGRFKLK